ncbi:hypothetical protein [Salinibacterium sp. PAMC 21357]|uniref:hypothetical protein n=1 Tax=Salinibacterium sp. PAMC 21357 TaxID=1112215 RepID=UPI0002E57C25|nr:hypothetical protein [Salinibacterium sp. PAMC 21357]
MTSSPEAVSQNGAVRDMDSTLPSEMSRAELQASVYGNKPDQTWIAWAVFGSIVLLAGAIWFVVWRRFARR